MASPSALNTGNGFSRTPSFENFLSEIHIGAVLAIPIASYHAFEQPMTRFGGVSRHGRQIGRVNTIPLGLNQPNAFQLSLRGAYQHNPVHTLVSGVEP